ncbi:hypothetical protein PUN28_015557 [Cardiocondyla obscurior]|uniref:Uncharacterized protein n=1 Tax=Cardiocondyla obscurior TaxID=286306 RepID=A0AAW2ETM4_9HYME
MLQFELCSRRRGKVFLILSFFRDIVSIRLKIPLLANRYAVTYIFFFFLCGTPCIIPGNTGVHDLVTLGRKSDDGEHKKIKKKKKGKKEKKCRCGDVSQQGEEAIDSLGIPRDMIVTGL